MRSAPLWLYLAISQVCGLCLWEQYRSESISVRQGHTSVPVPTQGQILTFGGYDNLDILAYNDLHSYDMVTQQWTSVSTTQPPLGRYGHSASLRADEMIIVGGGNGSHLFGDVWSLNVSTFVGSCLFPLTFFPVQPPWCGGNFLISESRLSGIVPFPWKTQCMCMAERMVRVRKKVCTN
jgi:hypothetical protein